MNARSASRGMTLIEVSVTIAIVALVIVACLQGLERSVLTAAHTRNTRLSRELGLLTLGQIESGLYWDDIDSGFGGDYSEEGYPAFRYEVALGDDTLPDTDSGEGGFDSWAYREEVRQRELELDDDYDPDDELEQEQPFEKVRVRVTFPSLTELKTEVTVEKWIRWEQVYGPNADGDGSTSSDPASSGSIGGSNG